MFGENQRDARRDCRYHAGAREHVHEQMSGVGLSSAATEIQNTQFTGRQWKLAGRSFLNTATCARRFIPGLPSKTRRTIVCWPTSQSKPKQGECFYTTVVFGLRRLQHRRGVSWATCFRFPSRLRCRVTGIAGCRGLAFRINHLARGPRGNGGARHSGS
jgi:hypothetical protein